MLYDPYAEFGSRRLPNGLSVHAAHWPNRPWEAVGFLIHSGAEQDPAGLEGLAHLTEHLVSQNAGRTKKEIRSFFEGCGGTVGLGRTSFSRTEFNFFAPADKGLLAEAFAIFGRMLIVAELTRSVDQEKTIVVGEFNRHYPNRIGLELDWRERSALYGDCWLGRFVRPLGAPPSIERIAQSDLRSFYDGHYAPANMSVVAVGGMTPDEIIELIAQSPFAENKPGTRTPLPEPTTSSPLPSEKRHVFVASERIAIGFSSDAGAYRSVARIPGIVDLYAIRALGRMLGEILTDEVRERRRWTYHIASVPYNYRHFCELAINCDALAANAVDEIEETVDACIGQAIDREDVFEKVKKRSLASMLMLDPTGREIRNRAIGELSDHGRIIPLGEERRAIEDLSMDDIRAVIPWIHRERRWTLVTRP